MASVHNRTPVFCHSIARKQCLSPGGCSLLQSVPGGADASNQRCNHLGCRPRLKESRALCAHPSTSICVRNVADSGKRRALDVGRQIIPLHMSAAPRLQDVIFLLSKNCSDRRAVFGEQDALKAVRLTCRRLDCEFRSSGHLHQFRSQFVERLTIFLVDQVKMCRIKVKESAIRRFGYPQP